MMFQDSEVEMQDRVSAVETAVDDAVDHGLPPKCAKMLRDIVFRTHLDVFRRALLDDPPARVEPMTVRHQPGARAVRAKPRASPPAKAAWLHEHMADLETAGMVFRNLQAIYASVAMAIPKGSNSCRMVTDYQAVNDTIEPAAMPLPNLEDKASLFADATAWCTLDLLQGYWQVPLREDDQEMFTMVTPEGLFTPRRVPPGVLNATGYFQATTGDVLEGYIDKICSVWVDDIVIWGKTPEILLKRLLAILGRLLERGFFAAAQKAVFFRKEIKGCGKILSGQTVSHDPERT